ncbi:signal peptide peptidase SppA [Methanoregula sp.]|jgi:protease IV|uniref:signal peptide peptidase SppA n=1 Tax=Methanoregula sp. TaxID=2052170 RepID=UPI003C26AF18
MDEYTITGPSVTVPPKPGSRVKWLLVVLFAFIVFAGAMIGGYYLTHSDTHGVTVVRMEGTIVSGDVNDGDSIGSEVVGNQLREAADDPMVEAIVLRVNSPGGSPAGAQEIIGDLDYAKTKKPVVVSMGDMATSAAYYVSAHADRIYADPDTLTAGVGVIWKFSDISSWMHNEGYNLSVVKSGTMKDMGSDSRPMTAEEQAYAQKIVQESFQNFIGDVTTQRVIARSDIDDGRVIRGADAVKLNIVDELGNLNDAIAGAKKMAESRSKSS